MDNVLLYGISHVLKRVMNIEVMLYTMECHRMGRISDEDYIRFLDKEKENISNFSGIDKMINN